MITQDREASSRVAIIAHGDFEDHIKIREQMIKDGFLEQWGVSRSSQWVLTLKSVQKQRRYSRYLVKQRIQMGTWWTKMINLLIWPTLLMH